MDPLSQLDDAPPGASRAASPGDADLALLLRVARGEPRARRTLAQMLVARVRRGALALMGHGPETEEAAVATLIELVRAAATFQAVESLDTWSDRLIARSVVRFAHAMDGQRGTGAQPSAAVVAHSLDELFARLPRSARQAFALVHVFAFPVREAVRLMGVPEVGVREDLELARNALVALALRGSRGEPELQALRHFWSLWERAQHPSSERGPRHSERRAALAGMGPWAAPVLAILAEAQGFLAAAQGARLTAHDRSVLARALSGLSSSSSEDRPDERSAAAVPTSEVDGPAWVPPLSIGLCVSMVVGAFVALAYHEPKLTPRKVAPRAAQAAAAPAAVPPTIEALPKAATTRRGAPLVRNGVALAAESPLYEGDALHAADGTGCLRIEPATELCLGAGSEVVLSKLARGERTFTLARGRAVMALEAVTAPVRVTAGPVSLRAERGTFGLERDDQGVVVRGLLGRAELEAFGRSHELGAEAALVRATGSSLERMPLLPEKARRDWELFAAHRSAAKSADPQARAKASAASPVEPGAAAVGPEAAARPALGADAPPAE